MHRKTLALAAILTLAAGAAFAADAPRGVVFKRATGESAKFGPAGEYYPKMAAQFGVEAQVVIRCKVDADNKLSECGLISESSPGKGFGAAALALAKDGRISAKKVKEPTDPETPVQLQVPFRLPNE